MTFQEFSAGYYSLEMHIQPYEEGPVIDSALYDFINEEVYSQTDAPVTFKLSMDNGAYFNVGAENGVPPNVLALPQAWVDNLDVEDDGRSTRIFVLKPGHAYLTHQASILEKQLEDGNFDDLV